MDDNFLAEVEVEGKKAFDDLPEEKTSPESLPEKETEKAPEGGNTLEDNVPFHKHPRWIEREKELSSLKEQEQENARVIAELLATKEQPKDVQIPDLLKDVFGDNIEAYKKFNLYEQQRAQDIERGILQRQEEERVQVAQETAKWNKWVDDSLSTLEGEGKKFDRNGLIKTMLEYRPTDENNNFDFNKGYAIYQALNKEDTTRSDARKEIGDKVSGSTRGEPKKKDYMTPADLRNRSWPSLS